MMRLLLIFVLLFAITLVGVFVGPAFVNLPGVVIIGFDVYTVEMRFPTFVVVLFLTFIALYLTFYAIRLLFRSGQIAKRWGLGRGQRKARQRGIDGLIALAEGNWQQAEKLMKQASAKSDVKLLNYLLAAQAAQEQGALDRRDEYLRLAATEAPAAELAIGLTQARLQMQQKQYEQALATLTNLQQIAPKHPPLLNQLKNLYIKLGDWDALSDLLPALKKHKVINDNDWLELSLVILGEHFKQQPDAEALQTLWGKQPKPLRKQLAAQKAYIKALISQSAFASAEKLLQQCLKKQVDEELLIAYCEVPHQNPGAALKFVEDKVQHISATQHIYLALAKIALENQLWGKAQSYLQQAQQLKATVDGYWLLAQTYQGMQDSAKEQQAYQAGLQLAQQE